ncbi:MAG: hypothetical protein AAF333_05450 [Planctomycetota bacterium]
MPRLTRALFPALIFAVVLGSPLPLADAASTQYLVTGELASSNLPVPGVADDLGGATFAFRLNFDEPAEPDFDLLGFTADSQPFAADRWSLDLFGPTGLLDRFDQDTDPDALGFSVFTGQITSPEDGETFIDLGVDTNPAPGRVSLDDTLIDLEFFADELVSAFFTNDLTGVPDDTAFVGGSVLDLGSGLRVPVVNASLVVAELDEPVLIEDGGTDGQEPVTGNNGDGEGGTPGVGDPAAVPTPGAAVGGLLLMLLLVVRQLDRTQRHAERA